MSNSVERISLSRISTVANYIESVYNLIYDADEYIRIIHFSLPELYRVHKSGLCECVVVDEASVFLLSESDRILRSKCLQFSVDAAHLVKRKYSEVSDYLNKIRCRYMDSTLKISQDLILYFSSYQQQLNWDDLSSSNYGNHSYEGDDVYSLETYASKKKKELDNMKFNDILDYKFNVLADVIEFGYRESLNTFTKLRSLLEESTSLYSSIMLLHVYIDILFLMCYIINYVYEQTSVKTDADKPAGALEKKYTSGPVLR